VSTKSWELSEVYIMRFLLRNLSDLFLFLFFKSILHTNNNIRIDGNGTIQREEIENLFVLNYGGKKKKFKTNFPI
jgi:hypothetical protein